MKPGHRVVVVGAGPAGIRAAEMLVKGGIRPIVIDESASWGGQIYRQPPANAGFRRTRKTLYGFESHKAQAVHETMTALLPHIDYRPETLAWSCAPGQIDTLHNGNQTRIPFSHLIVASGATDRVLPVSGWTLPGVYTLGAAQVALKAQGCAVGSRVVFAGTGPLLYLVAYQYVKAGAHVAAVLDTSPLGAQLSAMPALMNQPYTLAKGLYYVGWLKAHGVRVERDVSLVAIDGERGASGIRWTKGGDAHSNRQVESMACDAVGMGFGLRPETQLADLLGCQFEFSDLNRCWLPKRDAAGRSSVAGVYVAGDGAGIAGADAAELAGRRAALALLEDIGAARVNASAAVDAARIERKLRRVARFRRGIEAAFAVPDDAADNWPDDLTICRCEEVKAGTLRACIRQGEAAEINRLKALTRVGMGLCQGRMCGEAAMTLLSRETGKTLAEVGRLRSQIPVKPISFVPDLPADYLAPVAQESRDE